MMQRLLKRLREWKHKLRVLYFQRNYYFSKVLPPEVPRRPLSFLPDGFSVSTIADSGVRVVEHFCSVPGASYLTSRAVEIGGEDTLSSVVFNPTHQDPVLMPLLYRAAMLAGTHINQTGPIEVGLVPDNLTECPLAETSPRQGVPPLCAIHVFLSDEGELHFPGLNVAVEAAVGRAVLWPLRAPDGSPVPLPEVKYAAGGSDQFWVGRMVLYTEKVYEPDTIAELIPQTQKGVALDGSEDLPAGAQYMGPPDSP